MLKLTSPYNVFASLPLCWHFKIPLTTILRLYPIPAIFNFFSSLSSQYRGMIIMTTAKMKISNFLLAPLVLFHFVCPPSFIHFLVQLLLNFASSVNSSYF